MTSGKSHSDTRDKAGKRVSQLAFDRNGDRIERLFRSVTFVPPEWCPLDVCVVIVIVHLQDTPLEQWNKGVRVRFTALVQRKQRTTHLIGRQAKHLYLQPHPSIHCLLHLHRESTCLPVHHCVAKLKDKAEKSRLGHRPGSLSVATISQ